MDAEQSVPFERREEGAAAPSPTLPPPERKLRLRPIDRQQVVLRAIDPDRLVEEDHPVRAIWDLLGQLDLSSYYQDVQAVEGRAGRDHSDPRLLIALWLYALSRGVRKARQLDEWAQYEPGCQWLLGLGRINYHTLSDFVTQNEAALDELFVQLLQPALERIEDNTGRLPDQTLVDGNYTTRQNILQTAEQPTELIGSLGENRSKNKLERHGVSPEFLPDRFTFDAAQNCFTCPAGKRLPYKSSKKRVPCDLSAARAGGGVFPCVPEREEGTAAVSAPRFGQGPSRDGLGLPELQCLDLDSSGVEINPAGPDIGYVCPNAAEGAGRAEKMKKTAPRKAHSGIDSS